LAQSPIASGAIEFDSVEDQVLEDLAQQRGFGLDGGPALGQFDLDVGWQIERSDQRAQEQAQVNQLGSGSAGPQSDHQIPFSLLP
jgi:hypothetical protein